MNGELWHKLIECFFDHSEKKSKPIIIISGYDKFSQLDEHPNNKADDDPIISPPLTLSFDSSSLLSYSVHSDHSILVTSGGSLLGIGDNSDGSISNSLPKKEINQFTEFSIKDNSGRQLIPLSAVCSSYGTLYMCSKSRSDGRQLVYCDFEINGCNPIFLDIGDQNPLALFGGYMHTAAINDKGEIIFINRDAIKNSPNSRISAVSLPGGEKASSIACLINSVVVLSSNGKVFSSAVDKGSNALNFLAVPELQGKEIVSVSGTNEHCFAVSKEGHVFGYGSNECGQLGIDKEIEYVSSFTKISSLLGYEIRKTYAGYSHSLFETRKGKILSCGDNKYGELLLSSGSCEEFVYLPIETTITSGSTFCIAGNCISVVFIGSYPPPNTPNLQISAFTF